MIETLFSSTALVLLGEMGDKTQLLTLVLFLRYRQARLVLSAIFVATLFNHWLAAAAGNWIGAELIPEAWQRPLLAALFVAGSIWVLIPDKFNEDDVDTQSRLGPWLTCFVAFFLAEMGDKTQLLTVSLAAKYQTTLWVTVGTTLGMMAANGLAILLGQRLHQVPMAVIRKAAALGFLVMAAAIYFS